MNLLALLRCLPGWAIGGQGHLYRFLAIGDFFVLEAMVCSRHLLGRGVGASPSLAAGHELRVFDFRRSELRRSASWLLANLTLSQ